MSDLTSTVLGISVLILVIALCTQKPGRDQ